MIKHIFFLLLITFLNFPKKKKKKTRKKMSRSPFLRKIEKGIWSMWFYFLWKNFTNLNSKNNNT
ncbi:hypothetical protein DR105_03565 [Mycoplasma hyorhinis]|nr:hypothetical protein [Mesomycoplasma hyorhinis]